MSRIIISSQRFFSLFLFAQRVASFQRTPPKQFGNNIYLSKNKNSSRIDQPMQTRPGSNHQTCCRLTTSCSSRASFSTSIFVTLNKYMKLLLNVTAHDSMQRPRTRSINGILVPRSSSQFIFYANIVITQFKAYQARLGSKAKKRARTHTLNVQLIRDVQRATIFVQKNKLVRVGNVPKMRGVITPRLTLITAGDSFVNNRPHGQQAA